MEVKIGYKQLIGEVKERNILYKAIIEIQELVNKTQTEKDCDINYQKIIKEISLKCDIAIKGIR